MVINLNNILKDYKSIFNFVKIFIRLSLKYSILKLI